jgi:hypothetical protein
MTLKDRVRRLEQQTGIVRPDELQPPDIAFVFVEPGPRDENGRVLIPGGIRCDSHKAQIGDRIIERLAEETLADFEKRLQGIPRPNPRLGKLIFMIPDEPEVGR